MSSDETSNDHALAEQLVAEQDAAIRAEWGREQKEREARWHGDWQVVTKKRGMPAPAAGQVAVCNDTLPQEDEEATEAEEEACVLESRVAIERECEESGHGTSSTEAEPAASEPSESAKSESAVKSESEPESEVEAIEQSGVSEPLPSEPLVTSQSEPESEVEASEPPPSETVVKSESEQEAEAIELAIK